MNKPHKHAELIKAWADGAEIEYYNAVYDLWQKPAGVPNWHPDNQYRIADPYRELKEAYAAGKGIEIKDSDGVWSDITQPSFTLQPERYRIKPEPNTRKLTIQCWMDAEEKLHWTNKKPGKAQWKRVPSEDKEIEVEV